MSTTEFKTEKQKKAENKVTSSAIMLSIEIASTFKLYSYRIIPQEQFTERVNQLIHVFQQETKSKLPVYDTLPEVENFK